jgi:hypothetical protein
LTLGSFAIGSAIFLILELNEPYSGLFRGPSRSHATGDRGASLPWAGEARTRAAVGPRYGGVAVLLVSLSLPRTFRPNGPSDRYGGLTSRVSFEQISKVIVQEAA